MKRLPLWMIGAFVVAGLLGLCVGVSGVVMTGSFAVSGPAATAEITRAHWKHVQHWYDALTIGSLTLLLASAVLLIRAVRKARSRRSATIVTCRERRHAPTLLPGESFCNIQ